MRRSPRRRKRSSGVGLWHEFWHHGRCSPWSRTALSAVRCAVKRSGGRDTVRPLQRSCAGRTATAPSGFRYRPACTLGVARAFGTWSVSSRRHTSIMGASSAAARPSRSAPWPGCCLLGASAASQPHPVWLLSLSLHSASARASARTSALTARPGTYLVSVGDHPLWTGCQWICH